MITNISLACENNCCLYYKPTDDRNHCRKSGSGTFNCRSRTLSSASVHFSPCHFTCITSCITATEICDTESTHSAKSYRQSCFQFLERQVHHTKDQRVFQNSFFIQTVCTYQKSVFLHYDFFWVCVLAENGLPSTTFFRFRGASHGTGPALRHCDSDQPCPLQSCA